MAQLVGFTFGSFGDIITIIGVVKQAHKALSESAGSSEDYQNLLADLDSFSQLLQTVQSVCSSVGPDGLPRSLENGIGEALGRSKVVLNEIYANIAGYQESLKKGGSGSWIEDSWRKIWWCLSKKEDIKEMRQRLSDCAQILDTLLSVSQSYVL